MFRVKILPQWYSQKDNMKKKIKIFLGILLMSGLLMVATDSCAALPPAYKALSAADLADQVEMIKIVPDALGTEELSKLWAAFQAHYRMCAAYRASVVALGEGEECLDPREALYLQRINQALVKAALMRRPIGPAQRSQQQRGGRAAFLDAPVVVRADQGLLEAGECNQDGRRSDRRRWRDQFVVPRLTVDVRQLVAAGQQDRRLVQNAVPQTQILVLDCLVEGDVVLLGDGQAVGFLQGQQQGYANHRGGTDPAVVRSRRRREAVRDRRDVRSAIARRPRRRLLDVLRPLTTSRPAHPRQRSSRPPFASGWRDSRRWCCVRRGCRTSDTRCS